MVTTGQLLDIHKTTQRCEAMLIEINRRLDARDREDGEHRKDAENRLRTVETRQHRVSGAYALGAALLSFIGVKIFGAH